MARLNARWFNFFKRGQSWDHFWQDSVPVAGADQDNAGDDVGSGVDATDIDRIVDESATGTDDAAITLVDVETGSGDDQVTTLDRTGLTDTGSGTDDAGPENARTTSDSGAAADSATMDSPAPAESGVGTDTAHVTKFADTTASACGPYSGPVEILYDGLDITSCVLLEQCSFKSQVNGGVGTATLRVKDAGHVFGFVPGRSLVLKISGVRNWAGYVGRVKNGYFFTGSNEDPSEVVRYFELQCVDYNVLYQKRILFDKVDPTKMQLTTFPPGTDDDIIIKSYIENHLDLSGDGLSTSGIEHVGTPSLDSEISGASGWTWGQLMRFLRFNTGAIDYIDPDGIIVHTDVDTPNAEWSITDAPGGFVDDFERSAVDDIGDPRYAEYLTPPAEPGAITVNGELVIAAATGLSFWRLETLGVPAWGVMQFDFFTTSDPDETSLYYELDSDIAQWTDDNYYAAAMYAAPLGDGTWDVALGSNAFEYLTTNIAVDASTWYTAKAEFRPDLGIFRVKVWKRGDSEPGWAETGTLAGDPSSDWYPALGVIPGSLVDAKMDNAQIVGSQQARAREIEIEFDAGAIRNDALVWGMGQGSDSPVFNRTEDASSIEDHNRWQVGRVLTSVWKQATVDRAGDSLVYGSPQNRRGGKDDAVAVRLVTFEQSFRVGQKVAFESVVWGYSDTLPIRSMEIDFPTPTDPRYRMVLSHEIDDPWASMDPFKFNFDFPGIGGDFEIPPFDIPPFVLPSFDPCADNCFYSDGFDRNEPAGWGMLNLGMEWDYVTDGGTSDGLSVNGSKAVMAHHDEGDGFWTGNSIMLRVVGSPTDFPLGIDADLLEGTFDLTIPNPRPTLGAVDLRLSQPNGLTGTNFVGLNFGVAESPDLSVGRATTSFLPAVTTASAGFGWLGGRTYTVRVKVDREHTFLKVWMKGSPEPSAWNLQVEAIDPVTGQPPHWDYLLVTESQSDTGPSTVLIDNICVFQTKNSSVDAFSRIVGPGASFGLSPFGAEWETLQLLTPDLVINEVDGSQAKVFAEDGQNGGSLQWVDYWPDLPGVAGQLPIEVVWRGVYLKFSSLTDGLDVVLAIDSEPDPSASNHWINIEFRPWVVGGPNDYGIRVDAGSSSDWGGFDIEPPFDNLYTFPPDAGDDDELEVSFDVRVRIEPSATKLRIWESGSSEPTLWLHESMPSGGDETGDNSDLDDVLHSVGIQTFGISNVSSSMNAAALGEIEIVDGIYEGPCLDPEPPTPDPPVGPARDTATPRNVPPGYPPEYSYFSTSAPFAPGTTRVWLNGYLLRRGVDYGEGAPYYGHFIYIYDTIDVTGKTVYIAYDAVVGG